MIVMIKKMIFMNDDNHYNCANDNITTGIIIIIRDNRTHMISIAPEGPALPLQVCEHFHV